MAFWFLDTPGIGALIVITVALSVLFTYVRMVRWIASAPRDGGVETGSEEQKA